MLLKQIFHVYVWILNNVNIFRRIKKYVAGIGGIDVYISNIERNTNENVWLDLEFET